MDNCILLFCLFCPSCPAKNIPLNITFSYVEISISTIPFHTATFTDYVNPSFLFDERSPQLASSIKKNFIVT